MHEYIIRLCFKVVIIILFFSSNLRYEEFIENSSRLNDITNYIQLKERSQRIGYEIGKVVYRGYHASDKLQVRKQLQLLRN